MYIVLLLEMCTLQKGVTSLTHNIYLIKLHRALLLRALQPVSDLRILLISISLLPCSIVLKGRER